MAMKPDSQLGIDEINRTIDEYRAKIDGIVQKEKERLNQVYEQEASKIVDNARREAEETIARSKQEAQKIRENTTSQATKEAAEIINQANRQAQRITDEAQGNIKKEAKNRTREEVEKILSRAREEANDIISGAKALAEKEADETVSKLREEAENIVNEEVEKYRLDAQAQIALAINEAQKRARNITEDIIAKSEDLNGAISQIIQNTEAIVASFKQELQTELGELTRVISMANTNKAQLSFKHTEGNLVVTPNQEMSKKDLLSVRLRGEQQGGNGNSLFKGRMEIETISPPDFNQMRKLKDSLIQIPNIKFAGEVYSTEETSLSFDVRELLPVIDILSHIPSVEKLEKQGNNITLVMQHGLS
jgi:F0F1-type ATP synthase membrane subunit b/b'